MIKCPYFTLIQERYFYWIDSSKINTSYTLKIFLLLLVSINFFYKKSFFISIISCHYGTGLYSPAVSRAFLSLNIQRLAYDFSWSILLCVYLCSWICKLVSKLALLKQNTFTFIFHWSCLSGISSMILPEQSLLCFLVYWAMTKSTPTCTKTQITHSGKATCRK